MLLWENGQNSSLKYKPEYFPYCWLVQGEQDFLFPIPLLPEHCENFHQVQTPGTSDGGSGRGGASKCVRHVYTWLLIVEKGSQYYLKCLMYIMSLNPYNTPMTFYHCYSCKMLVCSRLQTLNLFSSLTPSSSPMALCVIYDIHLSSELWTHSTHCSSLR